MAFSRYEERIVFDNTNRLYEQILDERGVNFIRQYVTPHFKYPTLAEFNELELEYRSWRIGDRYWKIAEQEYGNSELWWVIALFNKQPTEAHLRIGQQVLIPNPLESVLDLLGL